jgi:cell division protein FtsI/penicillin-binding protein 2
VADDSASCAEEAMRAALPDGAALLFDITEGRVLAAWGREILLEERPAGSLLKLFTAYALLSGGAPVDEVFHCEPTSVDIPATESCWYKPGHGNMTLKSALVQSCNAYFRQWLEGKSLKPAESFFRETGLVTGEATAEALLGFKPTIRPRPVELVAAAAALFNAGVVYSPGPVERGKRWPPISSVKVDSRTVEFIAQALLEAADSGTGAVVGRSIGPGRALVKTGTSLHWLINTGGTGSADYTATDGWCLAFYPAGEPALVLLAFAPGGTGAGDAAQAAGKILSAWLEGEGK